MEVVLWGLTCGPPHLSVRWYYMIMVWNCKEFIPLFILFFCLLHNDSKIHICFVINIFKSNYYCLSIDRYKGDIYIFRITIAGRLRTYQLHKRKVNKKKKTTDVNHMLILILLITLNIFKISILKFCFTWF